MPPLGATRGFLLKWRLGWEHATEYFGKEFHLNLHNSSFQFINVVHAPPGVTSICHPISVIDSRDGFLQSSYHGPDVIKGVVAGFCNDPPPILQPGSSIQRLNKRRARKMAYDASIQWQTYTVNTSYSRMLLVSSYFMEELRELVAVPFVDGTGETYVSFGYVSIANYNIIASRPRPVSEHNHLLSHRCQKTVDFWVVARESGCTNVMIGISSNGIEVSLPLGTISKRELVQPFLINSLFPDSVLRLINIATLPLVSLTLLLATWLWLTLL